MALALRQKEKIKGVKARIDERATSSPDKSSPLLLMDTWLLFLVSLFLFPSGKWILTPVRRTTGWIVLPALPMVKYVQKKIFKANENR